MMLEKLGLGTVQFGTVYGINNEGGQTPKSEVEKILQLARKSDIRIIDTAHGYGTSEIVLGRLGVEDFNIITKFLPDYKDFDSRDQIEESFKRLNVRKLYAIMAHRPMDVIEHPEIWEHLNELKVKGNLKKIGFSYNSVLEIDKTIEAGFYPDIVQVPYNYLDQRFKSKIFELRNLNCEIHTRSTFLQGLFFMAPEKLPGFFDPIKKILNRLQGEGNNLSAMLLHYTLSQSFIDYVIIGVNNAKQLQENIASLKNVPLLEEQKFNLPNHIISPSEWPKLKHD